MNDELFNHVGDLMVKARPDSGMDMRQGPSGPGPRPDTNYDDQMDQDDDPMEGKKDKSSGLDLGALERDLLEYQFSEDDDDGDVDGHLLSMTPSSFIPYEGGASQSVPSGSDGPVSGITFLDTLPEEEWERYQSELERKAGVTWNRVTFMERTWDVIRRYATRNESGVEPTHHARGSRGTNELRRV